MTSESYHSLIVQLDARFSELGIFCNELPTWVLRKILAGELMLVVQQQGYGRAMKWCRATQRPLGELFSAPSIP